MHFNQLASITRLEPKIELNKGYKTRINMLDIRAQVNAGQKKWDKGIDL